MLSVEEELIGPIASKRAFVGRCPSVTQKVKGRQPYWSPTCTREDEFTAALQQRAEWKPTLTIFKTSFGCFIKPSLNW